MNSPVQHLLNWFTPVRRQLISASAVDKLAGRPGSRFSRFLAGQSDATFQRVDLKPYYPVLQLVGYLPPGDIWVPERTLTPVEASSDLREWFTPARRALISLRQLDILASRPVGVLGRYLKGEPHVSFKIIGIQVYYPALRLMGFESNAEDMIATISTKLTTDIEHLLRWFTPERRRHINTLGLDITAEQPEGTLSAFLAGYPAAKRLLAKGRLAVYYPALATVGYYPDLDLDKDRSVQVYEQQPGA